MFHNKYIWTILSKYLNIWALCNGDFPVTPVNEGFTEKSAILQKKV